MESVELKNKVRSSSWSIGQYGLPVVMALLSGCGLTLLTFFLYEHGFASKILLYLGEKALLIYDGNPPRLENMGFNNPPFPLFLVLLVKNPFVGTALAGGGIVTACLITLYRQYRRKSISFALFALLVVYLTLSPLSLYLFSQHLPAALLFFLLLLTYHHLYKYCRQNISYNLFMFGFLSALIFLTDFQAILLIPLFTFSLVTRVIGNDLVKSFAILITGLFPVVFVTLSWSYLNWLFLGDPLYFVSHWRSTLEPALFFPENILNSRTILGALQATARLCWENSVLLLPYFMICLWLTFYARRIQCCVTKSVILAPVFLLVIELFLNFTVVHQYFFLFFIAAAVSIRIHNHTYFQGTLFSAFFTLSVCISLVLSFCLPCNHQGAEEQFFSYSLLRKPNNGNLDSYKSLLKRLKPKKKILMDDAINFPLVFMLNEPKRFILPYEYEFDMVLSAPHHFVHYIISSDLPSTDRVAARYPLASFGYIPEFSLVGQFGNLFLYEVAKDDN